MGTENFNPRFTRKRHRTTCSCLRSPIIFQSTLHAQATSILRFISAKVEFYFNPRFSRKRHRIRIFMERSIILNFNPRFTRKRHPCFKKVRISELLFQSTLHAQATSANIHNIPLPTLCYSSKFYLFSSAIAT